MKSWIEYWNSETPIYVSARHKALHYRLIATGIRDLILDPGIDALDYGCGRRSRPIWWRRAAGA